jgi:hypothetical protein
MGGQKRVGVDYIIYIMENKTQSLTTKETYMSYNQTLINEMIIFLDELLELQPELEDDRVAVVTILCDRFGCSEDEAIEAMSNF